MPPVDRQSPSDEPMTPYQRLIRETREAKGMSPTDLARRAGLPRSTIYAVEGKTPKERPEDATVDKLAGALGISREQIIDAVSESLGLRVAYGRPTLATQQLLDHVRHLPPEQAERWHRLARALADVLGAEHDRDQTGTDSDLSEKNPTVRFGDAPSLSVDVAHTQTTPERHAVLVRLGEALDSSPEVEAEIITFSEQIMNRVRQQRTGG